MTHTQLIDVLSRDRESSSQGWRCNRWRRIVYRRARSRWQSISSSALEAGYFENHGAVDSTGNITSTSSVLSSSVLLYIWLRVCVYQLDLHQTWACRLASRLEIAETVDSLCVCCVSLLVDVASRLLSIDITFCSSSRLVVQHTQTLIRSLGGRLESTLSLELYQWKLYKYIIRMATVGALTTVSSTHTGPKKKKKLMNYTDPKNISKNPQTQLRLSAQRAGWQPRVYHIRTGKYHIKGADQRQSSVFDPKPQTSGENDTGPTKGLDAPPLISTLLYYSYDLYIEREV